VVVDTGYDEFVVLEVVEEWIQLLRYVEDVIVHGLTGDWCKFAGVVLATQARPSGFLCINT